MRFTAAWVKEKPWKYKDNWINKLPQGGFEIHLPRGVCCLSKGNATLAMEILWGGCKLGEVCLIPFPHLQMFPRIPKNKNLGGLPSLSKENLYIWGSKDYFPSLRRREIFVLLYKNSDSYFGGSSFRVESQVHVRSHLSGFHHMTQEREKMRQNELMQLLLWIIMCPCLRNFMPIF